ncbi:L-proline trans-4-hydroxylase-like [Haliotis cracherodii]|uniref:L-proline trans-4-hydroxylase-like n=1 Tax=Haliotis cracherodii TaxID=6455 RepID=UPI0039E87827
MSAEFQYDEAFDVTDDVKRVYDEHGYILIRGLLDSEETAHLKKSVEESDAFTKHSQGVSDGDDRSSKLAIWRHPGNDVTGMVTRCDKVAGFSDKLLGGESYIYHCKLMMKEPLTGGKFLWHQDYGYWYKNCCLFPDMLSVFLPVDRSVKENGCLEILEGSHRCGRVEHLMVGGQTGADVERVAEIRKKCTHRYVEMEPGDALFFHCNLLHSSGINNSNMRRWVLICAFNKATNNPVYEHEYPQYTKLNKVPNSAIRDCNSNFTDVTGKNFVDLRKDKTVKVAEQ